MRLTFALTTAASSLAVGVAALSAPAFAQSAGSVDFDKEIVVTGTTNRTQQVGGVAAPDTARAKAVLTAEAIQRGGAGQTVLDAINQIPGVSFQNNDAYGSAGGTLNIRGFDASRINLTLDGVPLNDSGNYAVYSNQQVDPEIIEEINVNLGTTDIDSPTASAVGGTVNLRSKVPDHDFGVLLTGSAGQFSFMRIGAMVQTGDLNASGTRAWIEGSRAANNIPFNNYGKIAKQQYNAKIYQPLGGSDFFSIAAHYNQNRNNFFGSVPLRTDLTQSLSNSAARVVGPNSSNRFPLTTDESYYKINFPCQLDTAQAGVADTPAPAVNGASCGTDFDRRYNPSNTGNIRAQLKLHLTDSLVFNFEPSYQYTKANGGGTVTANEGLFDINPAGGTASTSACATAPVSAINTCVPGYFGSTPYFGRDINGDGDKLDTVTVLAPSQTQTRRIVVTTGVSWEISDHQALRVGYTYDRARHRQTGEVELLRPNGEPYDVFASNIGAVDAGGTLLQKRDRLSFAILNKVFAEYKGKFLDNRLEVTAGLSGNFFRRNLTQNCFTTSAGGNLVCLGAGNPLNATYAALNPTVAGPQQRVIDYKKAVPSLGFVYKATDLVSVFGNFSQSLSVPGADSLYNAFVFPAGTAGTKPAPETTDNFDFGVRARSGRIQGAVSGFYNQFHNRLASAYDPVLDQNVYRNLGSVKKYGIDAFVRYEINDVLTLGLTGNYLKSKIRDNIVIGENQDGTPIYALTAGKREGGAPKWTWGFDGRAKLGPVELGVNVKRTGPRYLFDTNEAIYQGSFVPNGAKTSTGGTPSLTSAQAAATGQVFGATAHSYWLVDLDARVKLGFLGLNDTTYLQLNVYNLTNSLFVGGFTSGLIQSNTYSKATGVSSYNAPPTAQIGAPRTVSGTVVFKF